MSQRKLKRLEKNLTRTSVKITICTVYAHAECIVK